MNLRFLFNEEIQYTDNYVLIVSCRNRSSSRNTHADIPSVLWLLGPYFETNGILIKFSL